MSKELDAERDKVVEDILSSTHPKRLLLAGAGAGKTFVFRKLLERLGEGDKKRRVIVTFINELQADLVKALGTAATVQTFHAYCHSLLRRSAVIRSDALTGQFEYFPKLRYLMASDWETLKGSKAPKFAPALRELIRGPEMDFYCERAKYYDAIGFDDSIVRVHDGLNAAPSAIPDYDLIIVDEFQDFNLAEVRLLLLLGGKSGIVVAGDDDQALYGQLRSASEEHIRALYGDADWKPFPLPFCMRCPSVIVNAVNGVIATAQKKGLLAGRIDKPYKPFPREQNDRLYPRINMVWTSVQGTAGRNYMGRYVAKKIASVDPADIKDSHENGFPTVLIIGPKHYIKQVGDHLQHVGYAVETKAPQDDSAGVTTREEALRILKKNSESNLGWRIIVEHDNPALLVTAVNAAGSTKPMSAVLPEDFKAAILAEAAKWEEKEDDEPASKPIDTAKPRIKLVTFEGSKGLSGHFVFIVGCQDGEIPRGKTMKDIDVAKFIVALTRTRKECHVLYTSRFGGKPVRVSPFMGWISASHRRDLKVDKNYWAGSDSSNVLQE